jgi:hypothetical protein
MRQLKLKKPRVAAKLKMKNFAAELIFANNRW